MKPCSATESPAFQDVFFPLLTVFVVFISHCSSQWVANATWVTVLASRINALYSNLYPLPRILPEHLDPPRSIGDVQQRVLYTNLTRFVLRLFEVGVSCTMISSVY